VEVECIISIDGLLACDDGEIGRENDNGGSAFALGCGAPRRSEVEDRRSAKSASFWLPARRGIQPGGECGDASPLSTLNAQRFNEEGFGRAVESSQFLQNRGLHG